MMCIFARQGARALTRRIGNVVDGSRIIARSAALLALAQGLGLRAIAEWLIGVHGLTMPRRCLRGTAALLRRLMLTLYTPIARSLGSASALLWLCAILAVSWPQAHAVLSSRRATGCAICSRTITSS